MFRHIALHTSRVASFPDRIAPSMVAGRPVAVQSPARKRFRQRVHDCGLLAFSLGSAAKVARRSLMMCQGGKTLGKFVSITTSFQTSCASISRGASIHRSAALMVAEIRSGKANSHSAVPFTMPVMVGSVSGGFRLKCTLTMARKVLGAGNSGRSRGATGAGTARITASSVCKANYILAEIECADCVVREHQLAELMTEAHHCAMALQIAKGRINESGTQAARSNQRAAGATTARKRLA